MIEGSMFEVDDYVKIVGYNGRIFRVLSVIFSRNGYVLGMPYKGFLYKVIDTYNYEILDDILESDLIFYIDKKQYNDMEYKDETIVNKINGDQLQWELYEGYLKLFDETNDEKYQDAAVNIYCELIHNRDN